LFPSPNQIGKGKSQKRGGKQGRQAKGVGHYCFFFACGCVRKKKKGTTQREGVKGGERKKVSADCPFLPRNKGKRTWGGRGKKKADALFYAVLMRKKIREEKRGE